MITAIFMPRENAILLADPDRDNAAVQLSLADAEAINAVLLRAQADRRRDREHSAPRHLARWPRGIR